MASRGFPRPGRRVVEFGLLAVLVVIGAYAVLVGRPGPTAPAPTLPPPSTAASATPSAPIAAADFGDFAIPSYDTTRPATGERSQSKLWIHGGAWWGVLAHPTTGWFHIMRLDWETQAWIDTGVQVEERGAADPDVLWDGEHLYIATGRTGRNPESRGRIRRYDFDSQLDRFRLSPNFPVYITAASTPSIVLAKDSTGRLWAAYTSDGRVFINRSVGDDTRWGEPFPLPVQEGDVEDGEIASIIAFDEDRIGVMWSDQRADAMYFAWRTDGDPDDAWTGPEAAVSGPDIADDHIHLKADPTTGRVLAATKTSLDESGGNPDAPLVLVLVREPDGAWRHHLAGRVRDRHTRPILAIDVEARRLFLIATSSVDLPEPRPVDGGILYMKESSLDTIAFDSGRGTPIGGAPGVPLSSPTSSKQPVSGETGLVLLTWDPEAKQYHHLVVGLGRDVPDVGDRNGELGAVHGDVLLLADDFSAWQDGEPLDNGWGIRGDPEAVVRAAPGAGNSGALVETSGDVEAAQACKSFPPVVDGRLVVRASVQVAGVMPGRDAVVTVVRGTGAEAASVRFDAGGTFAYATQGGTEETDVPFQEGAWYRSVVTIDVGARRYAWTLAAADGTQVVSVVDLPWVRNGPGVLDQVCLRTSAGAPGLAVRFDDVSVVHVPQEALQ